MITVTAPGLKRLTESLTRYYSTDPRQMFGAVRQWWFDEGEAAFKTDGSRVGSPWAPVTKDWAARKMGRQTNVNTGALKAAMIGRRGSWSKYSKSKGQVGVQYEPAAYNTIAKWRPLTGTRTKQMGALDKDMQVELDRYDRTLPQ
jgi:hypothetical protein